MVGVNGKSAYANDPQVKINVSAKILRTSVKAERIIVPYFYPFLIQINRKAHKYDFFPRRWLESPAVLGILNGFSDYQCARAGITQPKLMRIVFYHTLSNCFKWPVDKLVKYLMNASLKASSEYQQGMNISKFLLQSPRPDSIKHEVRLSAIIYDEYYRVAAVFKMKINNPILQKKYKYLDFQIALGW